MAKRAPPKLIGSRLPVNWRDMPCRRVWSMLYFAGEHEYEVRATAFETAMRGRLSEDWEGAWKQFCRDALVRSRAP